MDNDEKLHGVNSELDEKINPKSKISSDALLIQVIKDQFKTGES